MRVLKWTVDRATGKVGSDETPIGWTQRLEDMHCKSVLVAAWISN